MNGSFLLDTNIVIAALANEESVKAKIVKVNSIFVPSISIGELYFGAKKSRRVKENLERLQIFISGNKVLGCDVETALVYGEIKNQLRLKGRPIPDNDAWIAAIAMQYRLTLVTRDAHFQEVENLETVRW